MSGAAEPVERTDVAYRRVPSQDGVHTVWDANLQRV